MTASCLPTASSMPPSHCNTGDQPKLIRIDSKAGHGHSKPISKIIDEYTDIQAFIMYNLGVKYKYKK